MAALTVALAVMLVVALAEVGGCCCGGGIGGGGCCSGWCCVSGSDHGADNHAGSCHCDGWAVFGGKALLWRRGRVGSTVCRVSCKRDLALQQPTATGESGARRVVRYGVSKALADFKAVVRWYGRVSTVMLQSV